MAGDQAHAVAPTRRRKTFVRMFKEPAFAYGVVRVLYGEMRARLSLPATLLTDDRRVLEQIIFEHYRNDSHIRTVLFVGCASYTVHYQRRYFPAHDYWTIDSDPNRAKFGAKQHVVARLEKLDQYFPSNFFDLIICNGVYGWGLNSAADCNVAMLQCYSCLADSGHMLFGWNDMPERDLAPLSEVRSLSQFSEYSFPAFGAARHLTDTINRHTYYFYQKLTPK